MRRLARVVLHRPDDGVFDPMTLVRRALTMAALVMSMINSQLLSLARR